MNTPTQNEHPATSRWRLARDLGVLQVKLLVDGFRDLMLVPASLIAAVVSLMSGEHGKPGPQFYHLLEWGRQSEQWIDLFGAVKNSPEKLQQAPSFGDQGMDDIVERFEAFIVDEYKTGGVTAQAKEHLDKFLRAAKRNADDPKG
jgi:hypothetical protein